MEISEILRLFNGKDLEAMISHRKENIRRLNQTIKNPAYQPGYIQNCKIALDAYERELALFERALESASTSSGQSI